MPTTNFVLADDEHVGFFLQPGANWNYWVYPRGGQFKGPSETDKDPCNLYLVARPYVPDHWDVQSNHPIVVLEHKAFPAMRLIHGPVCRSVVR